MSPPRGAGGSAGARSQLYALLLDSLDDEHELAVAHGAIAGARELGVRLLCVAGAAVDDRDPRISAKNFAFEALAADQLSGTLALSSAIGNALGPARLGSWLGRFQPLPVVCLGVPLEGYASLRVDNGGGIREIVSHLIEVHDKRSIAFVRGPAQSEEAELRLSAYQEALLAHGIQPEQRLIVEGDYNRASGAQAVRTLLDQRKLSVHSLSALVCANDYMALGALDELNRRGIQVPEQVALTGFDDVPSADNARPALTTVRQPSDDLGREGLRQLLALVNGAPPEGRVLPVQLVIRRSCGCANKRELSLAERAQGPIIGSSVEGALMQRRQLIVAELSRAARGTFGTAGPDWENHLLSALVDDLREGAQGALGRKLQRMLQRMEQAGSELTYAPQVVAALRRQALPCVAAHAEPRDRLEEAVQDAQQLLSFVMAQSAAGQLRVPAQRFRALSRRLQEQMLLQPAQLSKTLAEHLPELGVDACLVAALSPTGQGELELRFGFGPAGQLPRPVRLGLAELPRHELLGDARTLFLLPLTLAETRLGLVVLSSTAARGELLEDLRELFAVVLRVSGAA